MLKRDVSGPIRGVWKTHTLQHCLHEYMVMFGCRHTSRRAEMRNNWKCATAMLCRVLFATELPFWLPQLFSLLENKSEDLTIMSGAIAHSTRATGRRDFFFKVAGVERSAALPLRLISPVRFKVTQTQNCFPRWVAELAPASMFISIRTASQHLDCLHDQQSSMNINGGREACCQLKPSPLKRKLRCNPLYAYFFN